jgi:tRNA(fMet)-specific endonuclease VapC
VYLLDGNVISDIAKNPAGPAAQRFAEEPGELLCTSIVVSAEVKFGFANGTSADTQRKMTAVLEGLRIVGLDQPVDRFYAAIRATLKKTGQAIGPNDLFIAAHALSLGATLVTADQGFRFVPELKIENWLRAQSAAG